jgi:2-polyprenyl-3-methyl-5-hydroxy-6-metoxy-1,4-benzoquinol methylase
MIDRLLQRWRIAKARRYIPPGARLLDVGSDDGVIFDRLGSRLSSGIGIDRHAPERVDERFRLVKGSFPEDLGDVGTFDAITMLAVLEHMPPDEQANAAQACERLLAPGGRLVVTTPSPAVDRILDVLERLRVIHGMDTEDHYGFDPTRTPEIFSVGQLRLSVSKRFQFGLNNLFVFEKG